MTEIVRHFLPDRIPHVDPEQIEQELHAFDAAPNIQAFIFDAIAGRRKLESAHGSALLYLCGIADEYEPDRRATFLDPTMPDIDVDLSDTKRDLVFDYLAEKYGEGHVARIGNISTLKPRGVLATIGKRFGISIGDTHAVKNVLVEYTSGDRRYGAALEDTMRLTDPGQKFIKDHPYADVMWRCENRVTHTSVHAAGVIVSSEPITNFASVRNGVMQLDKNSAEAINLLKIDVLGLRTLGVIEDAGVISAEELYGLKLDDPEVFKVIQDGRYVGVFQFEGAAQRRVAAPLGVENFEHFVHVNALCRPGPLGAGAADIYISRKRGLQDVTIKHPLMEPYLAPTRGVVLFQEQVMQICRDIGKFSWRDITKIRRAMSKRMGDEWFNKWGDLFAEGADSVGLRREESDAIWSEINGFGSYGFVKAHAVSYSIISYYCAYLKAYHPIEYAAALLRSSQGDEQVLELLRELRDEGVSYTPFDILRSKEQWAVEDGVLIGGFQQLPGIGPKKAAAFVEKRDAGELSEKEIAFIRNAEAKYKFTSLTPVVDRFADYYANPSRYGVRGKISTFDSLEDQKSAVVIGRLMNKVRRDENENVRAARRDYKPWRGNPLFLDLFMVDDTITKPVLVRVRHRDWFRWGQAIADIAEVEEDYFLIRGRWLERFQMMSSDKIRCITKPDLFRKKSAA